MRNVFLYHLFFLILITITILVSSKGQTCTSIANTDSDGNIWVSKSFDYHSGTGYLFVNKRNVQKKSLTLTLSLGKAWTSKYASITFNQVSRNFPYGGINEAGVNMEILWLAQTQYPPREKISQTINESQVIQYILDTAGSTKEAVERIKSVEIVPIMATVHYMICDKSGECVAVEYLDGKLVVTNMVNENEKILQNSIYSEVVDELIRPHGRTVRVSADRLGKIFYSSRYAGVKTPDEVADVMFANLDMVNQGSFTKWQIVYKLDDGKVWFQTMGGKARKSINLHDFKLDCDEFTAEMVVDINNSYFGDAKRISKEFSLDLNSSLMDEFEGVPQWMKTLGKIYENTYHRCSPRFM